MGFTRVNVPCLNGSKINTQANQTKWTRKILLIESNIIYGLQYSTHWSRILQITENILKRNQTVEKQQMTVRKTIFRVELEQYSELKTKLHEVVLILGYFSALCAVQCKLMGLLHKLSGVFPRGHSLLTWASNVAISLFKGLHSSSKSRIMFKCVNKILRSHKKQLGKWLLSSQNTTIHKAATF